jgi:hypothetical protein
MSADTAAMEGEKRSRFQKATAPVHWAGPHVCSGLLTGMRQQTYTQDTRIVQNSHAPTDLLRRSFPADRGLAWTCPSNNHQLAMSDSDR